MLDFTLLVGFGISAIFSGQVCGDARYQSMFPHVMAASLVVKGEASAS
jgi:hypothetical protein